MFYIYMYFHNLLCISDIISNETSISIYYKIDIYITLDCSYRMELYRVS